MQQSHHRLLITDNGFSNSRKLMIRLMIIGYTLLGVISAGAMVLFVNRFVKQGTKPKGKGKS